MRRHLCLFFLFFGFFKLQAEPYYVGIELLYFKPTIDQSYYAITSSSNVFKPPGRDAEFFPSGTRHNNDPNFYPGFRLEMAYESTFCCNGFGLRFAYYNQTHTSRLNDVFLFDTALFPGSGAARPEDLPYTGTTRHKHHFQYYALDATFNRLTCTFFPEHFAFLLGAHFAYIQMNERQFSQGFSTSLASPFTRTAFFDRSQRNSKFWGVGPQFGFTYRYLLPYHCLKGLGVKTDARASLLASHTTANLRYISTQTGARGVAIRNEPSWRINPCADVKLGLTYHLPCCFCKATFELGYELLWYSDAIDAITGFDPAYAGLGEDLFSNLNLQGPYISIGASF